MGIIYFDICSIPLFLLILFVCYTRKMTRGTVNQLFILLVLLSLISAVADLVLEVCNNMVPLSEAGAVICGISAYTYLAIRNVTNAVLLLYLLALTHTTHLMRKKWVRIAYCIPYICILILLVQNLFTHSAFTITMEGGYSRGPLMIVFYAIAMIYGVVGLVYCVYSKRYLPDLEWRALLNIYIIVHIAVVIQFFFPKLLLEMYFTAIAELLIMVTITRPERRMDIETGIVSWTSYQTDIKNILLSGEHVHIIVIRILNSQAIRKYMGDQNYSRYLSEITKSIRDLNWKHPYGVELYYEKPGTIYLITDTDEPDMDYIIDHINSETHKNLSKFVEMGIRFEPQYCFISCPDDLDSLNDIISLGHSFHKFDHDKKRVSYAADIVHSKSFEIEANITDILNRAIKQNFLEMYYQPIYDMHTGSFRSAEALARIIDPKYGMISPAVFIPAAEKEGYMVPIGDMVLEQAFRFVSEHDMDSLGMSYIEVNLSAAQIMESRLTDKISHLEQKYRVDPARINFEITETSFETVSDIMIENVDKLIEMGYSFALDDYGTGYSNIQRVNTIPLKIIKIDKTMTDEIKSENGRKILENTIRMMQSVGKQLVVEGAEGADTINMLKDMNCDYIQGFYYSRPLPVNDFISFIKQKNYC